MTTDLCNWPNNSLIKLKWKFLQRKSLKSFQESLTKHCSFWYALLSLFLIKHCQKFYCFFNLYLYYLQTFIFVFFKAKYKRYYNKYKRHLQILLALLYSVASSEFGSKSKFALEWGTVAKSKHFNETTGRRDAIAQGEYSKRIKIVFKIRSFRIHPRSYIFKRFTYTT